MKILRYILLFLLMSNSTTSSAIAKKINIVATVGHLRNVTEMVGRQHVDVIGLMGSGVDPHLYKATESDVMKLANAEIIFYNGLHLEAKMGEIFKKMSRNKKTVAVGESAPKDELLMSETYVGQTDPHIWFDVTLWMKVVEIIRDTLIEYDPEHAADYSKNTIAYLESLKELHAYVQKRSLELPDEKKILVTAHDAFRYFGKQYGFEVVGLQGISTESEAGIKDVIELANFVTENKIRAMFIESSVPVRNIQAVQEAVQKRGWNVEIGGELFSDAMGDDGTHEGTYIGMVEHNINTIVNALKD
jgi:manganese/zinc/iron transport system substrate-binding protein